MIQLNRDGTLPVPPRKEPDVTFTTFHFPTITVTFKKVPNPKWSKWKFWEPKTINEYE